MLFPFKLRGYAEATGAVNVSQSINEPVLCAAVCSYSSRSSRPRSLWSDYHSAAIVPARFTASDFSRYRFFL
jgi:hypothetical protein